MNIWEFDIPAFNFQDSSRPGSHLGPRPFLKRITKTSNLSTFARCTKDLQTQMPVSSVILGHLDGPRTDGLMETWGKKNTWGVVKRPVKQTLLWNPPLLGSDQQKDFGWWVHRCSSQVLRCSKVSGWIPWETRRFPWIVFYWSMESVEWIDWPLTFLCHFCAIFLHFQRFRDFMTFSCIFMTFYWHFETLRDSFHWLFTSLMRADDFF